MIHRLVPRAEHLRSEKSRAQGSGSRLGPHKKMEPKRRSRDLVVVGGAENTILDGVHVLIWGSSQPPCRQSPLSAALPVPN